MKVLDIKSINIVWVNWHFLDQDNFFYRRKINTTPTDYNFFFVEQIYLIIDTSLMTFHFRFKASKKKIHLTISSLFHWDVFKAQK